MGHFCTARSNVEDDLEFRLRSTANRFRISSVCIPQLPGGKYETMVFQTTGELLPCGCQEVDDFAEAECVRDETKLEAMRTHLALHMKYAGKEYA